MTVGLGEMFRPPAMTVGLGEMFKPPAMIVGLGEMFKPPAMTVGLGEMFRPPAMTVGIPESFEPSGTDALVDAREIALRVFSWVRDSDHRTVLLKSGMVMAALAAAIEAYEQAGFRGAVIPLLWVLLYLLDLANSA
ncbi:MAG TPA: hypothetical protein VFU94_07460 [Conexibacter sp.]|nr:hypothetical protein [Conexibacter sp.]